MGPCSIIELVVLHASVVAATDGTTNCTGILLTHSPISSISNNLSDCEPLNFPHLRSHPNYLKMSEYI